MILDHKLPFWLLFFIEQFVGKVLFLTLSGTLGFLMLVRTGQLLSLSQSTFESVGLSNLIWRWTILDEKYFQKSWMMLLAISMILSCIDLIFV